METRIGAAPTLVYPESDGEPMAETPKHLQAMTDGMDVRTRKTACSTSTFRGNRIGD